MKKSFLLPIAAFLALYAGGLFAGQTKPMTLYVSGNTAVFYTSRLVPGLYTDTFKRECKNGFSTVFFVPGGRSKAIYGHCRRLTSSSLLMTLRLVPVRGRNLIDVVRRIHGQDAAVFDTTTGEDYFFVYPQRYYSIPKRLETKIGVLPIYKPLFAKMLREGGLLDTHVLDVNATAIATRLTCGGTCSIPNTLMPMRTYRP